jgi:hypothetical protein
MEQIGMAVRVQRATTTTRVVLGGDACVAQADVSPAQSRELAAPEPGGHDEQPQGEEEVVTDVLDEGEQLAPEFKRAVGYGSPRGGSASAATFRGR